MKRRLAVILSMIVLAFTACSPLARPSGSPSASPSPVSADVNSGVRCADLVAKALTSPNAVVPGAYECLDANGRAEFANSTPPVKSDGDFTFFDIAQAQANKQPALTIYKFAEFASDPQGDVVVSYRVSDAAGGYECLGIFMAGTNTANSASSAREQAQGKQVDGIQFLSGSTGLC